MRFIIISSIIALALMGGAFFMTRNDKTSGSLVNNVNIVDGVQVIDLRARGGYKPEVSTAQAGIPTILKVNTSGTFDCSSAIRIPSMNVSRNLPPSGSTEIDLGIPVAGILQGTCGMGMYPFEIDFQS